MEPVRLSRSQARKIILHAAGLARKAQFGTGTEAAYRVIDHLGFVQLDTNYVVERAHHHVLASRVPDYEPPWLDELSEDGRIFEYFTSDAGYLPMTDFRFSLPVKKAFSMERVSLPKNEAALMKQILDQVERDGPVMVDDFENDRQEASSGWWDWRPAKVALERLYFDGDLMIRRNKKFRKVYDVPINFLPADIDTRMPADAEFAQFIIRRTLGALGIGHLKEMAWRARRVKGNQVKAELGRMVEAGTIRKVEVEGVKGPLYMLAEQKTDVRLSGDVFILSPFDILNVFRHRLRDFFDFDYQIECFVPAAKRVYGYFSLPILSGETFIARMDAKAERKKKLLVVHNLHFEPVDLQENEIGKLINELKAFVRFNQCHSIEFSRSNNAEYLEKIRAAVRD
ncbi:MAG: YcaQ family DNA glycosylase [Mucilaginibacter polytrichastri]|nr:YcaQ family DNA glycosylase [Mucilaginibacter polytrichastri]